MVLSTVRIEALDSNRNKFAVGTGYFYDFPSGELHLPVVITNKHVIEGAKFLRFTVQVMPTGNEIRADGSAEGEYTEIIDLEGLDKLVVRHPSEEIDLCAVLLSEMLNMLIKRNLFIKHNIIDATWRLTPEEVRDVSPVEQIIMVGYPNGLWDQTNNRPLTRQGLTASHVLTRWNGRSEFVIDCACFGGSSGSPIYLYKNGLIAGPSGGMVIGIRGILIGTLYAGPTFNAEGILETRPAPTNITNVPIVTQMLNLGYVIHVSAVDDLQVLVHKRVYEIQQERLINGATMQFARSGIPVSSSVVPKQIPKRD